MESGRKKNALKCPVCGGNFAASDLLDGDDIVVCLSCGEKFVTSEILNKSDDIRITEIQANVYRDVEATRSNERVEIEKGKREVESKQLDYKHQENLLKHKQQERSEAKARWRKTLIWILVAVAIVGAIIGAVVGVKYIFNTLTWNTLQWIIGATVGLVLSVGSIVLAKVIDDSYVDWLEVLPNLILFAVVIANFVLVCKFKQEYIIIFNFIAGLTPISTIIVRRLQDNAILSFSALWRLIGFIADIVFIVIANIIW